MPTSFIDKAIQACKTRDNRRLQQTLRASVSAVGERATQHWFREDLPEHLDPDALLWLLRTITGTQAEFNQRRDVLLEALTADLARNGHVPGVGFSIAPDEQTGRAVHIKSAIWEQVRPHLSARSAAHYACFLRLSD